MDNVPPPPLVKDADKALKAPPPLPNNHRHRALYWLTFGIILLAIAWGLLWFFYLRYYEYTDDAYANGNLVNVTPVISGAPIAFFADNTDLVLEGQLLVQLDRTDYQIRYEQQLASLAATILQVRQLYNTVNTNLANVKSKQVRLERARYDYENRRELLPAKAVSNEDYTHSQDDLRTAELDLRQAESQLQVARDAVGNTEIEDHPMIKEQKNRVREAYYNLRHCNIYAPTTGYVAQRNVEVGQWVRPETPMMAIIPKDYMWVDANYKETQLTWMRIGQPASVTFDIYGSSVVFEGKVLGIASGSGSVFSLIPPQNATGNWIKIVQRLPVRISIDPEKMKNHPLRLGLSAEVYVDLTNTDGPMLAQVPSTKPIAITRVFDLSMEEVDSVINEVIQNNLTK